MKRSKTDKIVTALFLIKKSLHKQSDDSLDLIVDCALVELYSRKHKDFTDSQFVDFVTSRSLEFLQFNETYGQKGTKND